jgi:D-glycero-D-manno-heptose 1,7-bisphosphate phosphatase
MTQPAPARALFLDRDGVINVDHHYVHRVEDFEFLPGIFELCAIARDAGLRLVVVTNQAGIGRGLYGEAEFQALTQWMCGRFEARASPSRASTTAPSTRPPASATTGASPSTASPSPACCCARATSWGSTWRRAPSSATRTPTWRPAARPAWGAC